MVNQETNNASRLDPMTGRVDEFPVGAKPYSYSDFTGHSLFLQFPQGTITARLEACGDVGAIWRTASWRGEVPAGTAVELRARTASSVEELADAPWVGPWTQSPVDLNAPPGPLPASRFLEVELTLRSLDGATAPRVESVGIAYSCGLL